MYKHKILRFPVSMIAELMKTTEEGAVLRVNSGIPKDSRVIRSWIDYEVAEPRMNIVIESESFDNLYEACVIPVMGAPEISSIRIFPVDDVRIPGHKG